MDEVWLELSATEISVLLMWASFGWIASEAIQAKWDLTTIPTPRATAEELKEVVDRISLTVRGRPLT